MISWTRETRSVVDLVAEIMACGPAAPEFDGLRVFGQPSRILRFLTGAGFYVLPVTVDLWPSLSCNARCPLCPYRLSGARDAADHDHQLRLLRPALSVVIVDALTVAGVRSIILTGGGDPLLHPDLMSIVAHIRHCGLKWAMFTNGILLSHDRAESLLRQRPAFLRVSLDAGSAATHACMYGVEPSVFSQVVCNIIGAARIAARRRLGCFGVSFTLGPRTAIHEIEAIYTLVKHIHREGRGGLGFVSFRPRLLHYQGGRPVCPQPHADGFLAVVTAIKHIIIEGLANQGTVAPKCDLKEGLFLMAASSVLPVGSLSSSWKTTVDTDGVGYLIGESAGIGHSNEAWGRIQERSDFSSAWFGPRRRRLFDCLACGDISPPLVHGLTPVSMLLSALVERVGGFVDAHLAREIVDTVRGIAFYRSSNADFV